MLSAAILLLVAAGLMLQHRDILDRIARKESLLEAGNSRSTVRRAMPTEMEQREIKAALDAQHALNIPWDSLLSALEKVQGQHAKIYLISVQPNPAKGEVTVSGEADDFASLMAYVKALRSQTIFLDVVLLSQRRVEEDEQQRLGFTLSAGWKP